MYSDTLQELIVNTVDLGSAINDTIQDAIDTTATTKQRLVNNVRERMAELMTCANKNVCLDYFTVTGTKANGDLNVDVTNLNQLLKCVHEKFQEPIRKNTIIALKRCTSKKALKIQLKDASYSEYYDAFFDPISQAAQSISYCTIGNLGSLASNFCGINDFLSTEIPGKERASRMEHCS